MKRRERHILNGVDFNVIRTHTSSMHNTFRGATGSRGIQYIKRVIEGELFKRQWVIFGRG